MNAAGFDRIPKVQIIRNPKLDAILLRKKVTKAIERRHTVGSSLNKTPAKSIPPVPELMPLRPILKRPNHQSRQTSCVPHVTFASISPIAGVQSSSSPSTSTPKLQKGTTVQLIIDRLNGLNQPMNHVVQNMLDTKISSPPAQKERRQSVACARNSFDDGTVQDVEDLGLDHLDRIITTSSDDDDDVSKLKLNYSNNAF